MGFKMFSLRTTEICEIKGKIRVNKKDKFKLGLGRFKDADGNGWDIAGIFLLESGDWVQACPMGELHPYYYDTSTRQYGLVSQLWEPYEIEWV